MTSEHDLAYQQAYQRARAIYQARTIYELLDTRSSIRICMRGDMPTHRLVSQLDAVCALLKERGYSDE